MWNRDDEPTFKCSQCRDTSMITVSCLNHHCGRAFEHKREACSYAVRCPCWLRANSDRIRMSAEQAHAKGKPEPKVSRDLSQLMDGTYPWRNTRTL